MCVTAFVKIFLFGVVVALVNCDDGEYYWRPWTSGSPPKDAVTARDYRGLSYIVEAYIPSYGLYIGQAFANQHEVNITVPLTNVSSSYVIKNSHSLKVLCSDSLEKLAWYPTSRYSIQNELVTAVIKPVLGGLTVQDHVVYIGRYAETTSSQRAVVLGGIYKDDTLHYNTNGRVYTQLYYEILVIGSRCKGD